MLGEQAAWKFVKENQVPWELSVVIPGVMWGPVLYNGPTSSARIITRLFEGDTSGLYRGIVPWYGDIRDVAKLHVLSLTSAKLSSRRILAVAGPAGAQAVIDILRKEFPAANLPKEDPPAEIGGMSKWVVDNSLAGEVLGTEWIGLEESVVDTAKSAGL